MRLFGQLFGSRMEVSGQQVYDVAHDYTHKNFNELANLNTSGQVARFESLQQEYCKSFDDSESLDNEGKNKYINVLPFDENRVRLKSACSGDYINASRIQGLSGENFNFIATQAPLPHTIEDFWLMVMQENVQAIVMLTQDSESRDGKMERYFPKHQDETFGIIKVKLETLMDFSHDTTQRQFSIENLQTGDTMQVMHYHYTSWPDHNASSRLNTLLWLVQHIIDSYRSSTVVVHCSAGIGRSGTFLTIGRILNRLKQFAESGQPVQQSQIQDACNIEKTIMQLRNQRMGLVQTSNQYFMCYQALYMWLRQRLQTDDSNNR